MSRQCLERTYRYKIVRGFARARIVFFMWKTTMFTSAPHVARTFLVFLNVFLLGQLLSLRDALRQRDNEIAILVNMLKQVWSRCTIPGSCSTNTVNTAGRILIFCL